MNGAVALVTGVALLTARYRSHAPARAAELEVGVPATPGESSEPAVA
jgi:hypothetical protein